MYQKYLLGKQYLPFNIDMTSVAYEGNTTIYLKKRDTFHSIHKKGTAPGEARTHGLQIMRLTRCLLRYGGYREKLAKNNVTHGGTRTPNLRFRRPTPYPLGHAGTLVQNSRKTLRQLA